MKGIHILLLLLMLASCVNHEENLAPVPLMGKWKLVEQLVDPGDGSGQFVDVSSDKTIQFFGNNKVTSNGSLCAMDVGAIQPSSGTYDVNDGSITPTDCSPANVIRYEIKEAHLILTYMCDEGCRSKYVRITFP